MIVLARVIRNVFWHCILAAWLLGLGIAHAEDAPTDIERLALVIGNNAYHYLPPLETALNDSRAMAETLTKLGFAVSQYEDLDRRRTHDAIWEFVDRLEGKAGLIYYAGHGVEVASGNYLLPVDIDPRDERDVERDGIHLNWMLNTMSDAGSRLTVVLLDACRDNPLPRRVAGRSIGAKRGLGQTSAPNGVMIVYSAGINEQALDRLGPDDDHPNGLFVRELLPEIEKPGVELYEAVRTARERIRQQARAIDHEQNPAIYDQIEGGPFYMAGLPPEEDNNTLIEQAWQVASQLDTAEAYDTFKAQFCPQSEYCALAELVQQNQTALALQKPKLMPGDGFRDCPLCPPMVALPLGQVKIGSPLGETGRQPEEGKPLTRKIERPFAMSSAEITFAQWQACLDDGGCSGHKPYRPDVADGDHPVVDVAFSHAKAYADWLSSETGLPYRLPSGEEWEFAARAGSQFRRHYGEDNVNTRLCAFANVYDLTGQEEHDFGWAFANCQDGQSGTAAVASYRPNAFGLYDMLGNVWEWVSDCWDSGESNDPCTERVVRGGSWMSKPRDIRSASMLRSRINDRDINVGFRVVRDLDEIAFASD